MAVWRQGKAKVNRALGSPLPGTHTARESTCRLPYEIVEMIVACITHRATLKACSLTCRSWYIVTAPHLYHTLVLGVTKKPTIPHLEEKPLSRLHGHRMPLAVKEIWVRQELLRWFSPQAFSRSDLRNFSAFSHIRTLRVQKLEIYRFMPDIERYFGHFSSTLQSITLYQPVCTPRQLSHFLSLFSNLDNIEISGGYRPRLKRTLPDPELVPFSAPKLRGQLELYASHWAEIWTYLINLCGGLQFHSMDLRRAASCAPILLEACAKTLETLRFYAADHSVGK